MYHHGVLSFTNEDREEAEGIARELWSEVARLGVQLDDIEVIAPCPRCHRTGYTISLGTLHDDDVRKLTSVLRDVRESGQPPASAGARRDQHGPRA